MAKKVFYSVFSVLLGYISLNAILSAKIFDSDKSGICAGERPSQEGRIPVCALMSKPNDLSEKFQDLTQLIRLYNRRYREMA